VQLDSIEGGGIKFPDLAVRSGRVDLGMRLYVQVMWIITSFLILGIAVDGKERKEGKVGKGGKR
jgi:hypothetical protein